MFPGTGTEGMKTKSIVTMNYENGLITGTLNNGTHSIALSGVKPPL